jgi:hypothetical protein
LKLFWLLYFNLFGVLESWSFCIMFNLNKPITGQMAKAKQAIRDSVKATIKNESTEFIKSAAAQGVPVSEKPFEAPKFELFPDLKPVSDEEKQQIEQQSQIRLQRLEEELRQMRLGRQQDNQEWQKQQTQIMNPEEFARSQGKEPPRREIIIPTSPRKGPSGAKRATQGKTGSREAGRQKST